MSAHDFCTHPKTKAARAKCRRETTKGFSGARLPIAPETTVPAIQTPIESTVRKIKSLSYETAPCYRCDGSGYYGPKVVRGGRCFACGGLGKKFTKAADRARAAYHEAVAREMNTPLADLEAGDVIYCAPAVWVGFEPTNLPLRWYRIATIEITDNSGVGTTDEQGVTIWHPGYKITFENCKGTQGASQESLEGIEFPRYDADASQRAMQSVAKLKGLTVKYYED